MTTPLFSEEADRLLGARCAPLRAAVLAAARRLDADASLPDLADVGGDDGAAAAALGVCALSSRVAEAHTSADGSATKLLVRLADGLAVESVVLLHDSGAGRCASFGGGRPGARRATLCVSSQAGCAMGCAFCATGRLGLARSLSRAEILEQVVHATRLGPGSLLRNVVFMGEGEPLQAYAPVCAAIRLLVAPAGRGGFGLPPRRVTVSTVGVPPRLRTLARDAPGVRLALSLHAPTQALRAALVPSAAAWPLDDILSAADSHEAAPGGCAPMVEYVLLRGVNDGPEQAAALGRLLAMRPKWTLNLIPWNHVDGTGFEPPVAERVVAFQAEMRGRWGVNTTVRRAMGRDVAGACGQLAASRGGLAVGDIEDAATAPARCGTT